MQHKTDTQINKTDYSKTVASIYSELILIKDTKNIHPEGYNKYLQKWCLKTWKVASKTQKVRKIGTPSHYSFCAQKRK